MDKKTEKILVKSLVSIDKKLDKKQKQAGSLEKERESIKRDDKIISLLETISENTKNGIGGAGSVGDDKNPTKGKGLFAFFGITTLFGAIGGIFTKFFKELGVSILKSLNVVRVLILGTIESLNKGFKTIGLLAQGIISTLKNFFPRIGGIFEKTKTGGLFKTFRENLVLKISNLLKSISSPFKDSKTIAKGIETFKLFKTNIVVGVKLFLEGISKKFEPLSKALKEISLLFGGIGKEKKGFFTILQNVFTSIKKFLSPLKAILEPVISKLGTFGRIFAPITFLIGFFKTVQGALKGFKEDGIKGALEGGIEALFQFVVTDVGNAISSIGKFIGKFILKLFGQDELAKKVSESDFKLGDFIENVVKSMIKFVKNIFGFGGEESTGKEKPKLEEEFSILKFLGTSFNTAKEFVIEKIQDTVNLVMEKFTEFRDFIVEKIKGIFDFDFPVIGKLSDVISKLFGPAKKEPKKDELEVRQNFERKEIIKLKTQIAEDKKELAGGDTTAGLFTNRKKRIAANQKKLGTIKSGIQGRIAARKSAAASGGTSSIVNAAASTADTAAFTINNAPKLPNLTSTNISFPKDTGEGRGKIPDSLSQDDDKTDQSKFKPASAFSISSKGLNELIKSEGERNKVYLDTKGLPTIGIGHLITNAKGDKKDEKNPLKSKVQIDGNFFNEISSSQLQKLFKNDVKQFTGIVGQTLGDTPITQSMFDALSSIAFNAGHLFGNQIKFTKEGNFLKAAENFLDIGPKSVIDSNRRVREAKLFLEDIGKSDLVQKERVIGAKDGAVLTGRVPVILAGEAGPEAIIPLNDRGTEIITNALLAPAIKKLLSISEMNTLNTQNQTIGSTPIIINAPSTSAPTINNSNTTAIFSTDVRNEIQVNPIKALL